MEFGIHLLGVHPVVGGTRVLLLFAADEGPALHPGHVGGVRPVEIAAREFFLVEFVHFAGGAGFLPELFQLGLAAVDPNHLIWFR